MEDSTHTRTTTRAVLASLLTLFCFSGSAADLSSGSAKEIKESAHTSENREVMKTSNKKLEERIKNICNTNPKKKADKAKEEQEKITAEKNKKAEAMKKEKEMKLAAEQKKKEEMRLATEKAKAKNSKSKNSKLETKDVKTKDIKVEQAKDLKDATNKNKDLQTVTNKNIEDKSKAKVVEAKENGDKDSGLQAKKGLRITFGGVVDAQGYAEGSTLEDKDYKLYNTMPGKSASYYESGADKIQGANPIFPQGVGNIGDYSDRFGMVADAILHLRAENKNEDLGILYGADVQFHVPVTEGKGASQGVSAARGRGAHLFVNSEYGDVKLGYQFGPEALMRLDATRIATVDGGADSDWFRKVNLEGSAASFPFYVTPRLYTESFSSESEKLSFRMAGKYNKGVMTTLPFRVAYYSPNYMGARFGVSYAPRYESSLFSVEEGSSAINLNSGADELTDKFIKAGNFSYDSTKKTTLAADISTATNSTIVGITGATASEKTAVITAAADALFTNIKQLSKSDAASAVGNDIKAMTSGLDIKSTEVEAISDLALKAATKQYANAAAFKTALTTKIGTYATTADIGKTTLAEAKAAVNAKIKEAAEALITELELNTDRIDDTKRKAIKAKVNEVYGNAIVLNAIKNGSGGSSAPRHVGPDYEHILSAGVSYEYDFDEYKVKVKASAVAEYGQAKQPDASKHAYNQYVEYNDLMGANFGVSADYKIDEDQSAKFAASFAYLGKSGQPKGIKELKTNKYEALDSADPRVKGIKDQFDGDDKNTMYWTAGAGYQYQDIYGSLTYFGSRMNDGDQLHDIALGVQYDLSPACSKSKFVPYAAAHYFWTKEEGAIIPTGDTAVPSNKGFLILTGVKFSF